MNKEIPIKDIINMTAEQVDEKVSCYGFYDWFCSRNALKAKSKRLLSTLRGIVKTGTGAFDPGKTYVFFKNNCPCTGGLYDDLRICDIESGRVLYNVCPKNPWYGYRPAVAFSAEDADRWTNPLVFESMKDVKAWFKDPTVFSVSVSKERIQDGRCSMHTAEIHLCTKKTA